MTYSVSLIKVYSIYLNIFYYDAYLKIHIWMIMYPIRTHDAEW
jgi:hypothetical protein